MATVSMKVETKVNDDDVIFNLKEILEISMRGMMATAKRIVPVVTGKLRDSIHLVKIDDFSWLMKDGVEYGKHVEFGTEPHLILPREKKALRFEKEGQIIFAKKVKHPGTNSQPFFRPSLDMIQTSLLPELFHQRFK